MSLPQGHDLKTMMRTAKETKAKEAEEKKKRAEENRIKRLQVAEAKKEQDIRDQVEKIEKHIIYAIKEGKDSVELRYGDGHTEDVVWDAAIRRLKKNKDYKFEVTAISVHCDNFAYAANVDHVEAREWWEPMWELKVTW